MQHGIGGGTALPHEPLGGQKVSTGFAETGDGESYDSIELGAASAGTPGEISNESWLEVVPLGVMVEGVRSRGVSCF